MQLSDAIELVDFLESKGYDAELYEQYSGRGMYGSETTGVTTNASPNSMDNLEEDLEEAEIDTEFRRDNMGLDYIYY